MISLLFVMVDWWYTRMRSAMKPDDDGPSLLLVMSIWSQAVYQPMLLEWSKVDGRIPSKRD